MFFGYVLKNIIKKKKESYFKTLLSLIDVLIGFLYIKKLNKSKKIIESFFSLISFKFELRNQRSRQLLINFIQL